MRKIEALTLLEDKMIYDAETLLDCYEERAAIIEYEGGYTRQTAEKYAAQCYGFKCVTALKLFALQWENENE